MLAQTLGVPEERLGFLARFGADELRQLRGRISVVLFDEHAVMFKRVSALAPIAPAPLVAKVAQAAVSPMVGGLAGGALGVDHPHMAAGVLSRLSPTYMADAAPYLDPRALKVLAPMVPPAPLVPAAKEMLRRRDYITAARFIEFATPELIRAFEPALDDAEGVLQVAAYTHAADKLSEIIRMLPEERLRLIVEAGATGTTELRLAAISLLARLDADLQARVGDTLFDLVDSETVSDFMTTVVREGAGDDLLAFAFGLAPAALELAIAAAETTGDPAVLAVLRDAAAGRVERTA
jgi:hypothetical protein